jgi:hypothetical protein
MTTLMISSVYWVQIRVYDPSCWFCLAMTTSHDIIRVIGFKVYDPSCWFCLAMTTSHDIIPLIGFRVYDRSWWVLPCYDNVSWYHPFNWVLGVQQVVLPCYDNVSWYHPFNWVLGVLGPNWWFCLAMTTSQDLYPFYWVLGFKGVWLVVFFCLGLWTTGQTQRDKHKEPKDHENTDCRQSFLNCSFCKGRKRKTGFCMLWLTEPPHMSWNS